jgi:hypothetical protein
MLSADNEVPLVGIVRGEPDRISIGLRHRRPGCESRFYYGANRECVAEIYHT